MVITIEMNPNIQSLQIIDNIYTHTRVCVCVCVSEATQQRNIREKCVTIKRIIHI